MAPWWVGATLAVLSFVGLRWIIPAIGSEQVFFRAFIQAGANLAWLPALFLGILAALSAFLSQRKSALLDAQTDIESLRALGWKQFEDLVGEAYRRQGYAVEESLGGGSDGGIDVILRKDGGMWLVQCKQWKVFSVGAPVIREIYGLVAHHHASGAIVITSGKFTRDAESFATGKPIELIDGPKLLQLVETGQIHRTSRSFPDREANLPHGATPLPIAALSCPSCGNTMAKRVARKGPNAGNSFWGCLSYPACKGTRKI